MITVTVRLTTADGLPDVGSVLVQPVASAAALTPDPWLVTQTTVRAQADSDGRVSCDVLASDDPAWQVDGVMPYRVTYRLSSGRMWWAEYVFLTESGPVIDLARLTPLTDGVDVVPVPVPGPQGEQGEQGEVSQAELDAALAAHVAAADPHGQYVEKSGDTMTGTLIAPDIEAGTVTVLADPTDVNHAATKGYVDTADSEARARADATYERKGTAASVVAAHQAAADPHPQYVLKSLLTSKGDLAVHDGTAVARLPVGGEGQSLTVSGGAPSWQPSRVGNLLTPNQAGARAVEPGFFSFNGPTLAAVSSSIGGGSAISATCKAGGTEVYALGTSGEQNLYHPVEAGKTYTFTLDAGNISGSRTLKAQLVFFNASYAALGFNTTAESTHSGVRTITAVAPQGAVYAYMKVIAGAGSDGDVFHAGRFGFWLGAGGDWAMPGEPILNQGRRVTRPNGTDRLVEVWDGTAWVAVHYDSGLRQFTPQTGSNAPSENHICRVGNVVFVAFGVIGAATQPTTVLEIPFGFKPMRDLYLSAPYVSTQQCVVYRNTLGLVVYGAVGQANVRGYFSWATADPIPTSLPGTLLSPAP